MNSPINIIHNRSNINLVVSVGSRRIGSYYTKLSAANRDDTLFTLSIVPSSTEDSFHLISNGFKPSEHSDVLLEIESEMDINIQGSDESIIAAIGLPFRYFLDGKERHANSFQVEQDERSEPKVSVSKSIGRSEIFDIKKDASKFCKFISTKYFDEVEEFMRANPDFIITSQSREIASIVVNGKVESLVGDETITYTLIHSDYTNVKGLTLEDMIPSESNA